MNENIKIPLKTAFYGGIVALYVSVVGIIETFDQRDLINGVVTLGEMVIVLIILGTAFLGLRRWDNHINPPHRTEKEKISIGYAMLSGGLSGLIVSLFLVIVLWLPEFWEVRDVFVNISPTLIEILTLDWGISTGTFILTSHALVIGLIGGLVFILPDKLRGSVSTSFFWLVGLGTVADLIRVSLARDSIPKEFPRFFVTSSGLTIEGAVTILVVAFILKYFGSNIREAVSKNIKITTPRQKKTVQYSQLALIAVIFLLLPGIVGKFPSEVLVNIGIYVVMGLGINIVVGMAGLLDLGYVGFFAVGAYSMALFTTNDPELGGIALSFWVALPLVILITAGAGLLVGAPVLKMRGDYLAIVTLGFGEIARFLALSDWFKPWLGGAQGIIKIPNIFIGPVEFIDPQQLYYIFLVASAVFVFISYRLKDSRVGRAWEAMREDEDVAEAMGINTVYYKLLAFAIGAMIASVSGAIFSAKLGTIYPHSFNVLVSITALSLLIVGGVGSLPGVIVGAAVLVGLPELLREFFEYRLLFYGALLIIMMLLKPDGLLPATRQTVDIEETDRAQDDWFTGQKPTEEAAD